MQSLFFLPFPLFIYPLFFVFIVFKPSPNFFGKVFLLSFCKKIKSACFTVLITRKKNGEWWKIKWASLKSVASYKKYGRSSEKKGGLLLQGDVVQRKLEGRSWRGRGEKQALSSISWPRSTFQGYFRQHQRFKGF